MTDSYMFLNKCIPEPDKSWTKTSNTFVTFFQNAIKTVLSNI